ncbi:MAG TPA: AsmA-like C-terminal region-containing protein [Bacteroidia bacterium]|jgi:hypothetical protein|nr:AsmA-like C-terminal region-containing protein [Bacteroidia bacterium]
MNTTTQPKSLLRRILKWTGITLLALIIIAIAVPFLFKGKIIAKAEEEMNKNMNAVVKLGDVDLSLLSSFPDFRLSMKNFYIANIDSFAGDTLISARELKLDLNLMSVIKGEKYEINAIVLDQPRIMAKVLKSGKASWDITKPSAPSSPDQKPSSPSSFKMGLKDFEIRHGNIVYDDASLNTKAVMKDMNFKLSGDFTSDVFDIKTMTDMQEFSVSYGGVTYLNKVNTKIKADLNADMPKFKFTFKDNEFTLNELVLGLDGYWAMPKDDMDMDLKFSAKKTDFRNILSLIPGAYSKDFANVKTSGKLSLDGHAKGVYGKKSMPAFGLNLLVDNATFQYPSLPKSATDIFVDLKIDNKDGVTDHTRILLNKFHINLGGNTVDAHALITSPVSDADINGSLLAQLNLGTLHDVIPLAKTDELNGRITADIKAEGRMSYVEKKEYDKFKASGKFIVLDMLYKTKGMPDVNLKTMYLDFTPRFVELTKFEANIGKSDIEADGKIENFLQYVFKNELLKGTFNMRSGMMNLDEFMSADTSKAAKPAAAPASTASVIPVPANIDFTLNASIRKMLYDKMEMNDVAGNVRVADHTIDLTELKMNMLDGSMKISGSYNTRDLKKPHVDFKTIAIQGFDIPKTFKTFNTVQKIAPVAEHATGKFSTTLSFIADLDQTMSPVMNTLTGNGNLKTDHVVVSDFGPLSKLGEALKMDQFKNLDVSNLDVSYEFKNGRLWVKPFDLNSNGITSKVEGSTGFDQTIDYKMKMIIPTAKMPSQAKDAINGAFAKVNSQVGTNISMGDKAKVSALIGGTVTKPTIKIVPTGMEGSVKDNVKDEVKAVVTQGIDKGKAEAKAQSDKILADAQVEAQRLRDEAAKASAQFKAEGYKSADDLVAQASNPIEKAIAKKAGEKAKKEIDIKAQTILDDGNKAAQKILDEAKKKSDDLLK